MRFLKWLLIGWALSQFGAFGLGSGLCHMGEGGYAVCSDLDGDDAGEWVMPGFRLGLYMGVREARP